MKRVFLFVIGVVGGLIALAVILALWPDIDPPDDSGHLPDWGEPLPDNPLAEFQTWLESESTLDPEDPRLRMLADQDLWDPETAADLALEFERELAAWHQFAAQVDQPWQWSARDRMTLIDEDNEWNHRSLGSMSQLVAIRAFSLGKAGDRPEEALSEIESLLAVGHGMRSAKGNLLRLLMADSFISLGTSTIEKLLASPEFAPSPEAWNHFLARLPRYELEPESLQFALQAEYQTFGNTLDQFLDGEGPGLASSSWDSGPGRFTPYLQRHRSLVDYWQFVDPVMQGLNVSLAEGAIRAATSSDDAGARKADLVRLFVHPNASGRVMVLLSLPLTMRVIERSVERDFLYRLLPVQIALHRYRANEGHYPEDLASLVPDYLASLPRDPFRDEDLIWMPEEGLLYSVGQNGKDNGGSIDRKRYWQEGDLGLDLDP